MSGVAQRIISWYRKITKLLGDYNLTMQLYNQRPHRYHCFTHAAWDICPSNPPLSGCVTGTYNTNTILAILKSNSPAEVFPSPSKADIEVWVIVKYRDVFTKVLESVPKAYDNRQRYPCYQFVYPDDTNFKTVLCADQTTYTGIGYESLCGSEIMRINRVYRNTEQKGDLYTSLA